MNKFDDYFSEPQQFSDGTFVASGKLSREEAAKQGVKFCSMPDYQKLISQPSED